MMAFFQQYGGQLLLKIWQHIYISGISLALGAIVAVPLGILLTRLKKGAGIIIGFASVLQTVPAMALLALMIPVFGIGINPPLLHSLSTRYCPFTEHLSWYDECK